MTGRLREQLETALRAVFSASSLNIWLQSKMDTGLYDEVVGEGKPETTIMFELVRWAERRDRLDELVDKLLADHSDEPHMKAFGEAWRADRTAPPLPVEPPGPMFAFVT